MNRRTGGQMIKDLSNIQRIQAKPINQMTECF